MEKITGQEKQKLLETSARPEVQALMENVQKAKAGDKSGLRSAPSLRPEQIAKRNPVKPIVEKRESIVGHLPQTTLAEVAATGRLAAVSTTAPRTGVTSTGPATPPPPAPSNSFVARGPGGGGSTPLINGNSLANVRAQARATGTSNRNVTLTAMSILSGMRFAYGVTTREATQIRNIGARRWLLDQIDHPDANFGTSLRGGREMALVHNTNPGNWAGLTLSIAEWEHEMAQRFYNIATTTTPFMARIAEFWHEHFGVIGYVDPADPSWTVTRQAMLTLGFYKDVALTHMNGYFGDMLLASSQHPAMLTHLNGNYNAKVRDANGNLSPIQNYARELMQLHSLSNDPRNYNFPVQQNLLTNANLQYAFHTTDRSVVFQGGSTLPVYNTSDLREVAIFLGGRGWQTLHLQNDGVTPRSDFWTPGFDSTCSVMPGPRNSYPSSWTDNPQNWGNVNGGGGYIDRDIFVPFMNFRVSSYYTAELNPVTGQWVAINDRINGAEERDNLIPGGVMGQATKSLYRFFRRLAVHPATATHISAKMIKYFISADPYAPEMVPLLKEMVRAWINSNGHLPTVYRAMINHNLSFSMDERIAKPIFKDPLLYYTSVVRTLESLDAFVPINAGQAVPSMNANDKSYILNNIIYAAADIGMKADKAPTVEGWLVHSNMYWKTPGGLIKRLDKVMQMAADSVAGVSPQSVYTRVLSSRLSARANSRAILTDTDPTRALAAVLLSPEFQYN